MGNFARLILLSASALLTTSCGLLGLKSAPWPTSVEIHNREAIEFYRAAPRSDQELGSNLTTRDFPEDGRLVGMAVSGGGARAAAFTLGVLAELQTINSPGRASALDQIDFISSNSGGTWGVAAYLADRAARRQADYSLQNHQAEIVGRFRSASAGRIGCWARRFNEQVTNRATYADVYSPANPVALPRAFFNASMLPAQAPFVFSDRYLDHYQVTELGACNSERFPVNGRLADLPIGFAAATSGSVPGYFSSYAATSLCRAAGPGQPEGRAYRASFCHEALRDRVRGSLRLVDGVLYDNVGYLTAFEIFQSQAPQAASARRSLLIIDSNFETRGQTVSARRSRSNSFWGVLMAAGLPGQDASFARLHEPMLRSVGVNDIVLLDFFSTSGLPRDHAEDLLDGLRELADFASNNVACYRDRVEIRPRRERFTESNLQTVVESLSRLEGKGGDCLASNFYRLGTLVRTTYQADPFYFTLLWQLGQLSVRMNEARIRAAVY
jgi:hypothetical protein